jgi:hypothetical protein
MARRTKVIRRVWPVSAVRAAAAFIREYRRALAHGRAVGLSDERTRANIPDWIYHCRNTGRADPLGGLSAWH